MLIDFERAELFNEPKPSAEESHTEESMPMTTEKSQIRKKIVDRARDEKYALEFIIPSRRTRTQGLRVES
ncbi:hypothetical protein E4U39_007089 [Claviceps sp. Clav50 group G5]|nr:hypothetical protein E4U39_007089 [Claviceps sp. Clav50 group G5]